MSFIYTYLICKTIKDMYEIQDYGRPGLVYSTFVYAFILEQFKTFVTLGLTYFIVVRRFMYLDINENEYNNDLNVEKVPK